MNKENRRVRAIVVLAAMLAGLATLADLQPARGQQAKGQSEDLASLVRGTIARTEALFSGRIEYDQTTGFPATGLTETSKKSFSFSGESWAVRNLPVGNYLGGAQVSHRGRYLNHGIHPQPNGSVDHTSHIGAAKRVDEHRPCPPYFAGTIWYSITKEFLQKNPDKAKFVKAAEVDGVKTQILEWPVPAEPTRHAFHGMVGLDRLRPPAMLRCYVAPQLGYALPRYEYVDSKGLVACVFLSSGFKEVAPGVFFPRECSQESYDEQGHPVHFVRYTIHRTEKVNETIPEQDFELLLPKETSVHDARDPKNIISFRVGLEPINTTALEKLLIPPAKSWWTRNWLLATVLGAGLGVLIIAMYIIIRRRSRPAPAA